MHGKPKSIAVQKDMYQLLRGEAPRFADLLRRCGKRVRYAFSRTKNNELPTDPAVLEWAKFYQRGLVEVTRAFGEVSDAFAKQPALTEAEVAEELRILAIEYIQKLSQDELRTLLAESGIADPANAGRTNTPTGTPSEGFS